MNISQPVFSNIEKVKFDILSSEDIRKLSVKQITNSQTFDQFLHPVQGGLYDLALGAFTDHPCMTCHLDRNHCPGHCGHIELPFNVYHCVYMDQAFRLFKSQCPQCRGFRLARSEINLFWCKLRLLRHGLLKEAGEVEDIGVKSRKTNSSMRAVAGEEDIEVSDVDEDEEEADNTIEARRSFVNRCIKAARRRPGALQNRMETEAISEARKAVTREFHARVDKVRKCTRCQTIAPLYRKNKYVGIFRKALTAKDRAKNAMLGLSEAENPLVSLNRIKAKKEKEQQRAAQRLAGGEVDEGVADMDISDPEDQIRVLEARPELPGDSPEPSDVEMEDVENSEGITMSEAAAGGVRKKKSGAEEPAQEFVDSNMVHASLIQLFEKEQEVLTQVYGITSKSGALVPPSADMFFLRSLLVPPNRYRKESRTGQDELAESQDNECYKTILGFTDEIYQIRREIKGLEPQASSRNRSYDQLQRAWLNLQNAVNQLIDRDKTTLSGPAALRLPEGIKQKLEKKEGMFRMNIMGKRVNFAARSVISPDPNIETNEIGIPPVFARKLTYPEPVTPHSFKELKQAVINGPHVWPGAVAIENENGQVINLGRKSVEDRQALANMLLAASSNNVSGARNKKVHRHLNNGDIVIMNRQPTLHKPSMMAHRARVLPGEKTIRMHYANCNTYNADFDGDEMNMHFPQNEIARAEALTIADTDHQYLSATAGKPLRGLIQDHISMGVWLTCMDTFFRRDEYLDLLYSALRPEDNHTAHGRRILLLEPALMKPSQLWTGKQVVSTILRNIKPDTHASLFSESDCATSAKLWGEGSEEGVCRIQDGDYLTGILDKKQIGPSAGGLIHTVYEAYGHTIAGQLLSILGRLLTRLLSMRAFSCGVEDLVLTEEGERVRAAQIATADDIGLAVAAKYVSLADKNPKADDPELRARLETVFRDDEKQAGLDRATSAGHSSLSSDITAALLPKALEKAFPKNQMQAMTNSGAKGSRVNANLISCNLAQQTLEGRRVPIMISGKTLPAFKAFDPNIRAGGYIVDRFLTGVRPQEYYFHAMAGREGLIDTAVKTSRSGYLQRCIIKGMEGLRAEYDSTVRDSDGSIVQYLYGEDGLDVCRQKNLYEFSFTSKNFLSLFANLNVREDSAVINEDAREMVKKSLKKYQKTGQLGQSDPAIASYPPNAQGGAVSEKFYSAVKHYMDVNPDGMLKDKGTGTGNVSKKVFRTLTDLNYMKSIVQAGEAIGVVAGQSIGEPSTQMTLNTFHLAGHAAKNVTLGIPRLREILMTASQSIKTPTMTLYLPEEISDADGEQFAKGITRLSLAELVDEITVIESVGSGIYPESRLYKVSMKLYPASEYSQEHAITTDDVVHTIENRFLHHLRRMTRAELKKRGEEKLLKGAGKSDSNPEIGKASRVRQDLEAVPEADLEGGNSDDEDGNDDDDATNAKSRANRGEETTYEDPDEDEAGIERAGERDASPEPETLGNVDEGYGGSPRESDASSSGSDSENDDEAKIERRVVKEMARTREARILHKFQEITKFSFDTQVGTKCDFTVEYPASTAKLLMQNFILKAASEALIQSIPGIASADYLKPGKDVPERHIITEGANLVAMREYQHVLDPHRMFTNDIGAMLRLYGVEAARDTIIREVGGVFQGHGIDVDHRHLTLVADYMTRGGGYSPFNRMGMRDKTSPFAKMSFETTFGFLRDAVTEGDIEDLSSPSARITVGRIGGQGTGMCDVFTRVS